MIVATFKYHGTKYILLISFERPSVLCGRSYNVKERYRFWCRYIYILCVRTVYNGDEITMNQIETADKICAITKNVFASVGEIRKIGRDSEHVYQARMDQFADALMDTGVEMLGIINDLDPRVDDEDVLTDEEIYAEVRVALKYDRQYAAESVMQWQSDGQDLEDIAGWLETSVEVLTDLIDEFTEFTQ